MPLRVPPDLRCQYPSPIVGLVGFGGQKGDGSRLRFRVDSLRFRLLLVLRFEGAVEAAKDFCGSGLRLGRKVRVAVGAATYLQGSLAAEDKDRWKVRWLWKTVVWAAVWVGYGNREKATMAAS
ncbi:hypothetical protein GW17_00005132 [Ensete ventricosum]|nr:hypothetical protein GW17_00005132 [Ensete ventricosum]